VGLVEVSVRRLIPTPALYG